MRNGAEDSVRKDERCGEHSFLDDGGRASRRIVVRELVAGKEFLFADRGETELRGFEDPVRLYEVRWDDRGS